MSVKAADILNLIAKLQNSSEGLSLDDIQNEYEVSLRTAQRMKAFIESEVYLKEVESCGKQKRWHIPLRKFNCLLDFSNAEISTLKSSINYFKQNNMPQQAEDLNKILNKINSLLQDKKKKNLEIRSNELMKIEEFAHRVGPYFNFDQNILNSLKTALINKNQIIVQYYNQNSNKLSKNTLEPYGILYGHRNHYLLAKHSDGYYGDEIHHFSLSKIESIEILDLHYLIPSDFNLKDYTKDMFGVFKEDPVDVEWRFDSSVANDVKHYQFHPLQTMTENKDGSITVKFFSGGLLEMAWHLYTWGNAVEVIKPKDFWDNI